MNLPVISDYTFENYLGEGATGQVYTARGPDGPAAIKLLKRMAVNRKLLGFCLHRARQFPHPNVVSIKDFSLEGKPMYVVSSLHAVSGLNGLPEGYSLDTHSRGMDPQLAWSIISQIAEGMAHLHKYGVVHCGLNPKNILVADQDETLVKICDFGLGWVSDISHIDLSEAFFYSSPEQLSDPQTLFEGQALRWDVYAFGATAYKLLQKRLPRGARYAERIRERPNEFNARACADAVLQESELQWTPAANAFDAKRRRVIESCLELNPALRPIDMRDVCVELRQIDQEERIGIERGLTRDRENERAAELASERTRGRWYRNATYGLVGVSAVSLLFNLTSGVRLLGEKKRSRAAVNAAEAGAQEARTSADAASREAAIAKANLAEAQKTSDASLRFLLKIREAQPTEAKAIDGFLKSIKSGHEHFLASSQNDPTLAVERLRAQWRLALIDGHLAPEQNAESAVTALNKLISEVQVMPAERRADPKVREVLAAAHEEIGRLRMAAGAVSSALPALEQANAIYQQLAEADPQRKDSELRRRHARAAHDYGCLLARGGDLGLALAKQREAMKLWQELAQGPESREEDEYYLAMSQIEVGLIRQWDGQGIEAFEAFQSASGGFSRLVNEWGDKMPLYTFQLARCYYYLANLSFQEKGDDKEAIEAREGARQLLGKLLESDMGNRDYQFYLARTLADSAEMYRDSGATTEAAANIDHAVKILSELRKTAPSDPDYQYELAKKKELKAEFSLDANQPAEALALLNEAEKLLQDLAERNVSPRVPKHIHELEMARFDGALAQCLEANGKSAEAEKARQSGLSRLSDLASRRPHDASVRDALKALRESGKSAHPNP